MSSVFDKKGKRPGEDKVFKKIFTKNMAKMHTQKSKHSMSEKEKRKRRAAKNTARYITAYKDTADETGRDVAAGLSITSSQVPDFADGKVTDAD